MVSCVDRVCKAGTKAVTSQVDFCRICDSLNISRFYHLKANYVRCQHCGSYTKILSETEYANLNRTYDPGALLTEADAGELRRILRVDEGKEILAPIIEKLETASPPRVLDIGCGQGANLLAARELGCDVIGIEPSREHSKTARDMFDLPVIDGYFTAERFAGKRFDLVILSHVIEHILNPRDFIIDIFEVVAPGGILVIVTPNAGSSTLRLVGRHWTMFKTLDHVSMLTEDAFRMMGLPDDITLAFRQSEYSWQPVVELLQGLRDLMRGWFKSEDALIEDNLAKSASHAMERFDRWRRVMWVFSVLSFPLHVFNRIARTEAFLIVEAQRTGAPARMRTS